MMSSSVIEQDSWAVKYKDLEKNHRTIKEQKVSAVDHGFEPRLGQTKDYKIGICCFSTKHAALRRKSKDWLGGIRIMCSSGATCVSADCCFSELAL